jgi:DNA-binding transcriptional LysR family regulator
MLLNIVAGSTAITLLPEDFLNKLPAGGGLSKLPVKNIPEAVKTNYGVVRLAKRQPSPAAKAFLQLLE